MRKFLIKVSGEQYEVEVEEVKNGKVTTTSATNSAPTATKATVSTPNVSKSNASAASGIYRIDSPMPGNILRINVKVGDVVKKGQPVFYLEAMKMENEISAPNDGKVIDIQAKVGDTVNVGQPIIILE